MDMLEMTLRFCGEFVGKTIKWVAIVVATGVAGPFVAFACFLVVLAIIGLCGAIFVMIPLTVWMLFYGDHAAKLSILHAIPSVLEILAIGVSPFVLIKLLASKGMAAGRKKTLPELRIDPTV